MDETSPEGSDSAALHEYIDAEIAVDGLETPGQEKTLYAALEHLEGVQSVNIAGAKVTVHYEPVEITKSQLIDAIQGAGFRIAEIESAAASPLTDALAKKTVGQDPDTSDAQEKGSS